MPVSTCLVSQRRQDFAERVTQEPRRQWIWLASVGRTSPGGLGDDRRRAARKAYDALLVQACAVVEVSHRLDALPEGVDREVERLRVAEALRDGGLNVSG